MPVPCPLFASAWLAVFLSAPPALPTSPDTLDVERLSAAPTIDGRVDAIEYAGDPGLHVPTPAGAVRIWLRRHGGWLYIAAALPDPTFYWGDDFVVSLDPDGSGGASPGDGDRQWYLRRVIDSSVVATASGGRWMTPGQEPPMLGPTRHGDDWDVALQSAAHGWSVELRIREASVKPGAGEPRIAIRTYNDQPRGWWSWPPPPAGLPAQRVERQPDLWATVRLR